MQKMFSPDIPTEKGRIKAFSKFVIERHLVYLKKTAGEPKPWTNDPILQNFSFTNVYRDLDRVSVWIIDKILKPYEQSPNLPFMLAAARLINWPDTLQELLDKGGLPTPKGSRWNPDKMYAILKDRARRKEKVITGAYIVNSIIPKDHATEDTSKCYYIPYLGLSAVWSARKALEAAAKSSLSEFVETLSSCKGWGPFMSYQVTVDLSYSEHWLANAEDLNTFTSPGPGTCRGMNWLLHGRLKPKTKGSYLQPEMVRLLSLVNEEIQKTVPKKLWTGSRFTGFEPLTMSNFSNCCCEGSKFIRSLSDDGAGMKTRYAGVPTNHDNQRTLF